MSASSTTIRRVLLLSAAVLLASLATLPSAVPDAARILLPFLVSLTLGFVLWRGVEGARLAAERRLEGVEAQLAAAAKAGSQLRHDLRGILSPALLTADRLSNSQDPIAKRAADTMIATIERAEVRLRDEQP